MWSPPRAARCFRLVGGPATFATVLVAVTGGSGFIGRRLVDAHVAQGDDVRVLTRNRGRAEASPAVEVFEGDLLDRASLEPFVREVDVLYHCAAEIKDERLMHQVNVRGTESLLEVAQGRVRRWVQLSSVGAYGRRRHGIVTEETPERPRDTYETTKTLADARVRQALSSGAFEVVLLRPSIVFGEGMPNQSLYALFSMIRRGWFFFVGKPGASANYVHVDDVVRALVCCGSHANASGRTYNLSDWSTMEEMVQSIAHALGRPPPRLRLPELPVRCLATTLGRLPRVPLTASRVDALTSRVTYPATRIARELGFQLVSSIPSRMQKLARVWKAGLA